MSTDDVMNDVIAWPAFGLDQARKEELLLSALTALTEHHKAQCRAYSEVLDKLWPTVPAANLVDLPFLPVRLFKHERLQSVVDEDIIKTMTSSGTSGQSVSQIFLDKQTSALQVKVLSRIMSEFIGPHRLPMLVIDCRATIANRLKFSARTAGILGFSIFGRDIEYALDDDMSFNEARVLAFLEKHQGQPVLMFGFTFVVWRHLLRWLESERKQLPLGKGILIHGGGWKQLQEDAVDSAEFRMRLKAVMGIERIHNYYGMVEQTGSIFMECEHGHLHASAWSDVIIRDPKDFKPLGVGQSGLIELLSVIPRSYPGHALLSEDEGVLMGVDNCLCSRKGKYFKVIGRIKNAEVRGCSDTYTQ